MSGGAGGHEGRPGSADPAVPDCRPGPLVVVVGPTAGGKTRLAVQLALAVGGEIVNADAMSLYRGMDVGTAKPSEDERQGVPHHVLDIWDVTHRASVVEYRDLARKAIAGILDRSLIPILVGGSGLYVRAVTDEVEFPGTDDEVRASLEADLAALGPAALHERLSGVDPVAAAAILPGNGRRIVRALEVVTITGRPFLAQLPPPRAAYRSIVVGVDPPMIAAAARIEHRVHEMFERGLVAEVVSLIGGGLREAPTASRALGYRQVLEWLDTGAPVERAIEDTVRATRRLARRQRSWFGRDPAVQWLHTSDPFREALSTIAHRVGT